MAILLKGGTIVTSDQLYKSDILIIGSTIAKIGDIPHLPENTKIIDCSGQYVLPGGIDPHCHIQMPSPPYITSDDWYSASRAAAAGGTTMIIDFVPTLKGCDPIQTLDEEFSNATSSIIDYTFHMSAVDWNPQVRKSIELAISRGINSCKCYLAYKGRLSLDTNLDFIDFFAFCRDHGVLPLVHCEDGDIVPYLQDQVFNSSEVNKGPAGHPKSRPPFVEASAVEHAISIAEAADCPVYIVHNTCEAALKQIEFRNTPRYPIFAEATITHLIFTDKENSDPDYDHSAGLVLSPPLRSENDRQALWSGYRRGILKTLATDHCPWPMTAKRLGQNPPDFRKIFNGIPAIEERMVLFWDRGVRSGLLSPCEFVAITASNAAKIFGMYPKKGTIQVGSDADIVVFDPSAKRVISKESQKSAAEYNIFEGLEVQGIPVLTISAGKIVWECDVKNGIALYKEGKLSEEKSGTFISREAYTPFVYGRREFLK